MKWGVLAVMEAEMSQDPGMWHCPPPPVGDTSQRVDQKQRSKGCMTSGLELISKAKGQW